MNILHIASTIHGGASTGMSRYREAMLLAGLKSRIVVAWDTPSDDPCVAVLKTKPFSLLCRLARRARVELDPSSRMLDAIKYLDSAADRRPSYELFSPPFSRCGPEEHPWVKEADVVNLHWVAGTVDWPRFFRKVRKPIMITLHDQQPYLGGFHYARDLEENPWLGGLESRVREIKRAALRGHRVTVIGNSEWNTREAKASGFFPAGTRYHRVYYPLDTQVYAPRPKEAARAALGLSPGRRVIGFACADLNTRRKGFDVLLAALQSLPAAVAARSCLLSFGHQPAQQIRDRVPMPWLHLGYLQTDAVKAAAYSAMDVFVVPSLAEAFGQTAIEALACGTAVIGSRTGGLTEALFGGEAGLLVEPANPGALLEALTSLLGDSERRDTLAAAGRTRVVERHAPARIGPQWLEICQGSRA
jgi:glycosyltransferase involved in cell wall biosynthesis